MVVIVVLCPMSKAPRVLIKTFVAVVAAVKEILGVRMKKSRIVVMRMKLREMIEFEPFAATTTTASEGSRSS